MTSERIRAREVHRYYQTWLESSSGFDYGEAASTTRHHADGSFLRVSNDKALIAFAQSGCLRLNAKRGIVTLIASVRQYILAEATKSLSLRTGLPGDGEGDELWFGNASLPRSQGISGAALDPPLYTATDSEGQKHTGHALVINDITLDDRYKGLAFAGQGVSFYAGVPITSKAGHHIGVYTITDNKPRGGLKPSELVFMQDMAEIVMRHLESVYNDAARYRGEQLVTGLGRFLEGLTSMHHSEESNGDSEVYGLSEKNSIAHAASHPQNPSRLFKGMSITNADPTLLKEVRFSLGGSPLQQSLRNSEQDEVSLAVSEKGHAQPTVHRHNANGLVTRSTSNVESNSDDENEDPKLTKLHKLFGRAANILRQCTAADGVIFYDATSTSLTKRCATSEFDNTNAHSGGKATNQDDHSTSEASDQRDYSSGSTDSEISEGRTRMLTSSGKTCGMLGYALDTSAASTANVKTIKSLGLTERSLRRFIKRYPRGKVFYFSEKGEISASESEAAERSEGGSAVPSNPEEIVSHRSKRVSGQTVASELIRAMPGARNVIWLPLWDFNKQRWCAGTFLWSRRPERLLAAQDDLTYLKTFGNSIMMGISRLDAQSADEAKSTFIANISHELRSPLHGILGSTEFLQETALDGFQSSMAHAVETCAKTLLDTVEHVLDYSKINQMSNNTRGRRNGQPRSKGSANTTAKKNVIRSSLDSDLDLANLFEEAVEAVYAGQTFRSPAGQHLDGAMDGLSSIRNASKDVIRSDVEQGSSTFSGAVRVILEIGECDNWWVRTQPGAIRRIVMNILGNSLKYTDHGTILVSMVSDKTGNNNSPLHQIAVCITIKDTGRGMSADFLRNHAFTPFSQESYLSIGTGLGLSIVRQIVNSLGGRIELDSEKDVGTEVRVFLTVPTIPAPSPSVAFSDILSTVRQQTPDLSLCLLDPNAGKYGSANDNRADKSVESALRDLAESWFGLRTTKSGSMANQSVDFFVYAEPPPISYLLRQHGHTATEEEVPLIIMATNAFESASLTANGINQLTDLGRILEIIAQPCGPHKLARALHRCIQRRRSLKHATHKLSKAAPHSPKVVDKSNTTSMQENPTPQSPIQTSRPFNDSHQLSHIPRSIGGAITDGALPSEISGPLENGLRFSIPSPESETAQSNFGTNGNYPTVLLVDDNDVNLRLLVAFMKKFQLSYVTAKDGLQATQAYEQSLAGIEEVSRFKYVVMDISMPIMDGIEATRIIRQQEKRLKIKEGALIIALTGLGAATTRQEMLHAGADYYLTKPVKFKELMEFFRLT